MIKEGINYEKAKIQKNIALGHQRRCVKRDGVSTKLNIYTIFVHRRNLFKFRFGRNEVRGVACKPF